MKSYVLLIVTVILSLFGVAYILSLLKDGFKLQKWRKKWYKMPYHEKTGEIKITAPLMKPNDV